MAPAGELPHHAAATIRGPGDARGGQDGALVPPRWPAGSVPRLEVSKIAKAADVRAYVKPKDPEKVQCASAQDFRRAFGVRWAAFEAVQRVFAGPFAKSFANSATSGGAEADPPEKRPVLENTERNRTRPGVIRTHDQGIMRTIPLSCDFTLVPGVFAV